MDRRTYCSFRLRQVFRVGEGLLPHGRGSVGDGWGWEGAREAVRRVAQSYKPEWRRIAGLFVFAAALRADPQAAMAILTKQCVSCHGAAKLSGLDLRSRETLLQGGTRGAAAVAGNSAGSLLVKALRGDGLPKMPPGKQALTEAEIADVAAWIDAGAVFEPSNRRSVPAPVWWSLRKPVRPAIPKAARNPLDAFLLATLAAKNIEPAPPAAPAPLVRRLFFDLHGIPPAPEDVELFLSDTSPDAWMKLIDRLLASPRYGERWGRHWLDVVRYADTGGFENDLHYANAWRYRDYVVQSLNADKPYDRFVQEQIAGDEIWPDNLDLDGIYDLAQSKKEHLQARIATGLYTIGSWIPAAGLIPDYLRSEKSADRVDVTGAAFLGMTFGCARCHDHKFDPIPQRDYYRLSAIFAASDDRDVPVVDIMKVFDFQKHGPRVVAMDDLRAAIKKLDAAAKNRVLTADERSQRAEYLRRLGEAYLDYPGPTPTATVLAHIDPIPDVHIEVRGDYRNKGAKVPPGLPSLGGESIDIEDPHSYRTTRRKQLALWLTSPDHPLTARVIVNRVWQGHFGWGLVRTPNDFGRQGEAPTHPELLDWLATEFIREGWSLKKLHRLILTSDAYQRSNLVHPKAHEADPENKLLWRMSRRRLEAEAVRDAILAVSGALNPEMGGPAVAPPLSDEEMDGNKDDYKWPTTVRADQAVRRSVYLYVKRAFRFPFFELFDAPDPAQSCARRETTNVPPQALALLNNNFVDQQAKIFAARLRREAAANSAAQIELAWRLALGRFPSQAEKARAGAILARDPLMGLEQLCLALFNLNEFLYID